MMRRRLLRLTCAFCLLLGAGPFAYRAAAKTLFNFSAGSRQAKAHRTQPCTLLHGKQLFTLAGYELNATFTPNGEFHCFEINKQ